MISINQTSGSFMKRYSKIFFLILPLLFAAGVAKSIAIPPVSGSHYICNRVHFSVACSASSMNGNKPTSTHQFLLFRNGVDQKSTIHSYAVYKSSSLLPVVITDAASINPGRVKHILSFSHLHVQQQEFLSSYSYHAPPPPLKYKS